MSGAALLKNPASAPYDESDGLRGLENIAAYAQYGPKALRELVERHGFPAVQFMGAWESSKALVDEWRLKRIRAELCQAASDGKIPASDGKIPAYPG